MKKLLAITGVILLIYLLGSATLSPPRAERVGVTPTESRALFTVGEYEGYVAVFSESSEPRLTDTAVASLPKSDRGRLTEGIKIYSEKELKSLLEDLCS